MKFYCTSTRLVDTPSEVLIVNYFEDEKGERSALKELNQTLSNSIKDSLENSKGKLFESHLIHTHEKIRAKNIFLVGSGKKEKFDQSTLSKMISYCIKALGPKGYKHVAFSIESSLNQEISLPTIVSSSIVGTFDTEIHKAKDEDTHQIEEIGIVLAKDPANSAELLELGKREGEAINWARTLVAQPSNILTPATMVKEAEKLAKEFGFGIEVLTEDQAAKKGMGAFASIARGSEENGFMVTLEYSPQKSSKTKLGLVGKGVTFDSGGLSIKPSDKMDDMKMDMAGSASVLGVMRMVGYLQPQIGIVAVLPITENLPSGKAVKPGDVVRAMNGKSIEINNTDAEGRVVLSDALLYAQEKGATHLIDLATLTGAVIVALGNQVSGLMGNNKDLTDLVLDSSREVGEPMWELPLFDLYNDLLKSGIADYSNVPSSRQAGAIAGGMFLKEFVNKDIPWVHLDIAGTAWLEGDKPYMAKGATGVGIKTLLNVIKKLEKA